MWDSVYITHMSPSSSRIYASIYGRLNQNIYHIIVLLRIDTVRFKFKTTISIFFENKK